MKLKYVLMNGLFMSAVLAACTDNEIVEVQGTQNLKDAISLGENFSITGNWGLDSRALYNDETTGAAVSVKSLWEPNDAVGGAWYAALTATTPSKAGFLIGSNNFGSNHPFTRDDNEGNVAAATFSTLTNAFAGKYVLYYPYNAEVAAVSSAIPVKVNNAQTMDVENPMAHVNESMFAYTNAEYVTGGNQAQEFSLTPVPVLYRLRFAANEDTRDLVGQTISKVVIESNSNHLYKEGSVTVAGSGYANATGAYAGTTATTLYTLEVVGNEDNADYQVPAIGEATELPFYLSVLPANEDIETLTIKVVTAEGDVFQKTLENLLNEENAAVYGKLTTEGALFAYSITLDEVGEEDGAVYTNEQFMNAWEAAQNPIKLGAPLTIESLSLDENEEIEITGMTLTVGTLDVLDGDLTIENLEATTVNVSDWGVLTTKSTGSTKIGALSVAGSCSATLAGVTEIASIDVARKGAASITGKMNGVNIASKVTGEVNTVKQSSLTLKNIELKGANSFEGIVEVDGNVLVSGATTVEELGTVKEANSLVEVSFSNLTNEGEIRHQYGAMKFGTLNNKADITISATGVEFTGTTTNAAAEEYKMNISAVVTNKGTFTNRGNLESTAAFNNNTGATLALDVNPSLTSIVNAGTVNVKAADYEDEEGNPVLADLSVTNNTTGIVNINLNLATAEVTFAQLLNEGIVNINKGVLVEKADDNVSMTAINNDYAAINVATGAELRFHEDNNDELAGGNIIVVNGSKVTNAITDEPLSFIGVTAPTSAVIKDASEQNVPLNTMILNTATTVTPTNATIIQGYKLVLRSNVTLKTDLNMTGKAVKVQEEILLTGAKLNAEDTFDPESQERTLTVDNLTVTEGKLLKVGKAAATSGASAIDEVVSVGGSAN